VIVTALLALVLPAAAGSSSAATGLRGHVTAGGRAAKHVQLSFRHVFLVYHTTTDSAGNYRVTLGAGSYVVTAGKRPVAPVTVTVAAGRVRVVNLTIR
jgi:hypothetical protein